MQENTNQKNSEYGHFLRSGDRSSRANLYITFKQFFNAARLCGWKIDIEGYTYI